MNTVNNTKPADRMKALKIVFLSTTIAGVLLKNILILSITLYSNVKILRRINTISVDGIGRRSIMLNIIYNVTRIVKGIDAIIPIG